ncbi:MAG: sigma-70 family RNA polymerase sigma factor [Candidatus Aenigmarchaeota archaeon]|nr:sigma-70 family RNA polymerase sigma factor [Candidatus Aenigmarchaeota archaeon]
MEENNVYREFLRSYEKGDFRGAVDILYEDKHTVYTVIGWVFKDLPKEDREDLIQDVLIRAYKYLPRFVPHGLTSINGWLHRIAKNILVDHYRNVTRRVKTVGLDAMSEEFMLGTDDVEEAVILGQTDSVVRRHVNNVLPDVYSGTVLLCDFDNLTYDQAAETLDIPVGTVRSRLHRGRKILREHYESFPNHDDFIASLG